MQGVHIKMFRRLKTQSYLGYVVLVTVLSCVVGCATHGKVKPAPVAQEPSMAKGPSVERLDDGREGFIIKTDQDGEIIWQHTISSSEYTRILPRCSTTD